MMRFFRRKNGAPSETEKQPSGPENARLYAIGDIHGRADLLIEMHRLIERDSRGFEGRKVLIYLGDYIDRGMQSRQVVEMLLEPQLHGFERVFLKGNHEQALLDFLDYPEATAGWFSFGGRETLQSYGISVTFMPLLKDMKKLAVELEDVLPDEHRDFLESGLLSWHAGDYYFVHAGVRPGVPLEDQHSEDQLWIRDEFIDSDANHGAVVVHGHTISPDPEIRPNRVGLDTGAFHSGVLSCLVVDGTEQRILQT